MEPNDEFNIDISSLNLNLDVFANINDDYKSINEEVTYEHKKLEDTKFETAGTIIIEPAIVDILKRDLTIYNKISCSILNVYVIDTKAYLIGSNGAHKFIKTINVENELKNDFKYLMNSKIINECAGLGQPLKIEVTDDAINIKCSVINSTTNKLDVEIDTSFLKYLDIDIDNPDDIVQISDFRTNINKLTSVMKIYKGTKERMIYFDTKYMYIKNALTHSFIEYKTKQQYFMNSEIINLLGLVLSMPSNSNKQAMRIYNIENYEVIYKVGTYIIVSKLIDGDCNLSIRDKISYDKGFIIKRTTLHNLINRLNIVTSDEITLSFSKADINKLVLDIKAIKGTMSIDLDFIELKPSADTYELKLKFNKENLLNLINNTDGNGTVMLISRDTQYALIASDNSSLKSIIRVIE